MSNGLPQVMTMPSDFFVLRTGFTALLFGLLLTIQPVSAEDLGIASMPETAERSPSVSGTSEKNAAKKSTGQQGPRRWTLNQQNADIREFIAQVASITGDTFVIDPRIKGGNTVSVISTRPMEKKEIYDIFLEVLSANGYAVIPKGKVKSIIPSTTAKTSSPDPENPARATMVTRVIDLHSVSSVEVIPIVRPLIAQYGHAAASASGNAVVISDQADNVDRITRLVRELDQASDNDYEVIKLEHAWVGDVAKIIQDTLVTGKGQLPSGLQVIADERSNRLVIKGNANKRARVRKLVQTLDQEGIRKSSTRVVFLRQADATNLADILNEASQSLQDESGDKLPTKKSSSGLKPPSKGLSKGGGNKSGVFGGNAFIKADETTNALVMIADPDTLRELESLVRQLDIRRAQVLIEAAIVEVAGELSDTMGFQWGYGGKNTRTGDGISKEASVIGAALPDIKFGSVALRNSNFGVLVNALSRQSNANLLSTPNMLTLDNEEAEFIVGQEVPFKTGSYSSDASSGKNPFNTFERKPVGLTLKITPHIGDGRSLRLEIEQEISSLTDQFATPDSDPITTQRKIKATVLIDDRETIVLGGILQDTITKGVDKIPLLGDIPLIGRLFRNSKDRHEKRNLMLFMRPTIVRSGPDLNDLTLDKYNTLRLIHQGYGTSPLKQDMPEDPNNLFNKSSHVIEPSSQNP